MKKIVLKVAVAVAVAVMGLCNIVSGQYNIPSGINQGEGFSKLLDAAITFDTSATQLFARMETQPTTARKILINNFIVNAKNHGYFQKADIMYILCGFDTLSVKLNWIKDAHNITACRGRWGIDTGWTGNGSNSILNTNYNLTSDKVNFTGETGTIAYYSNSITFRNSLDADYGAFTTFRNYMTWSSNKYYFSWGAGELSSVFTNTPLPYGLIALVQSTSTKLYNYNQTDTITDDIAKNFWANVNNNMGIGGQLAGSNINFSSSRCYQFFYTGGVLTQEEVGYMYSDLMSYMEGIGTLFSAVNIINVGDSYTFGTSSTNDSDYVNLLRGMLGSNYTLTNKGVWGETDSGLYARYTADVKPLIHPFKTNILIYQEGYNSLVHDTSPDSIVARQERYCDRARADGIDRVIAHTLNNTAFLPNFDSLRLATNILIRGASYYDDLCDIGLDSLLGCSGCNTNEYFYTDFEHYVNKGYNRWALLLLNILL